MRLITRCNFAGESAPIDILYRVDHSAITADQVLVDENVLEANEDLMNAIQNTAMSTAMHDKILSCNGFGKTLSSFQTCLVGLDQILFSASFPNQCSAMH